MDQETKRFEEFEFMPPSNELWPNLSLVVWAIEPMPEGRTIKEKLEEIKRIQMHTLAQMG